MAVSKLAVERSGLSDPIIDSALRELATGKIEDATRRAVEELVHSLDEEYFDLKDAGERGEAPSDAYRPIFRRARAANAVFYALSQDSFEAATEALYEAKAATLDIGSLRDIVRQLIV